MSDRTIVSHGILRIGGRVVLPGDKSISHRAILFGALAQGTTFVKGVPVSDDIDATIRCLKDLGVSIERSGDAVSIRGAGRTGLATPSRSLDCGGSGTTMRLLLGALTGRVPHAILVGDASLSRRPMGRVIEPLSQMGASIDTPERPGFPPLHFSMNGAARPARIYLEVASAQVKTAVILAALAVPEGRTIITGAIHSRDHSERLLPRMGGSVVVTGDAIIVEPSTLNAIAVSVPGDPSAGAVFAAAAALSKGGELLIEDSSLNPTRLGFFEALSWMGVEVDLKEAVTDSREPQGDIRIQSRPLKAIQIPREAVPSLIDELPLLFLLATQAQGESRFSGLSELRVKESDRLAATVQALAAMGARIESGEDWVAVHGPTPLKGARVSAGNDHRISMMLTLAALTANGVSSISGTECESKSFPSFHNTLQQIVR